MRTIFEETDSEADGFTAINAATGDAIRLSMQQLLLTGRILPVGARLFVRHTFASSSNKPVEAVYSFMLPRDAALRRFRVSGPGFSARSELRPVEEATDAYEKGIDEGHLATLARVYRDGMINLSVGNLRTGEPVTVLLEILAGVDLRDDGLRFRFPFTVAPSYHRSARAIAIDDTAGEMELPEEEFGDLLLPQFRTGAKGLHEVGFDLAVETPGGSVEIASPSHKIRVGMKPGEARVSTAAADGVPNKDLIVDVRTSEAVRRVLAGKGSDGRMQFAAAIPSSEFGEPDNAARSVVFVLDRSGSMSGETLEQARRALLACLATLTEADRFGIVAFDNVTEVFSRDLLPADRKQRDRASRWLKGIDARGGTELAQALRDASRIAAGPGADLFVVTDGEVWGTEDFLADARRTGVRLHVLGIGSASQDRFLTLLGRETGGVSRFVTPRERVDAAALDWFASVSAPVASGLDVPAPKGVTVEPRPPETVFKGAPVLITGSSATTVAAMEIVWDAGRLSLNIEFTNGGRGESLRLLRGSRLITDAESRISESLGAVDRRRQSRELRRVESLSREYDLASRAMALVAVVERAGDLPGEIPDTKVVPVGFPEGMEMGWIYGSPTGGSTVMDLMHVTKSMMSVAKTGSRRYTLGESPAPPASARIIRRAGSLFGRAKPTEPDEDGGLFELAARLEPDGGMAGDTEERRVLASLLALLAFCAEGSTPSAGPFRVHVKRLIGFLRGSLPGGLSAERQAAAQAVIRAAEEGQPPKGDWADVARDVADSAWERLLLAADASGGA